MAYYLPAQNQLLNKYCRSHGALHIPQMKISVNVPAFAKVHRYTKFQNWAYKGVAFVHVSGLRTTSVLMLLMGGILITNSL